MKVICVGFPKTGTKSICSALRILGLNVYDYEEQVYLLHDEFMKILSVGASNEEIRKMFEGVDATTDVPTSMAWEIIANAFPEAKILHMERGDEDVWFKSLLNQFDIARKNVFIRIMISVCPTGYRMRQLLNASLRTGLGMVPSNPIYRAPFNEPMCRMKYREHNSHVRSSVPADKLLIYKFTDGWQTLCDFLELPVPDKPFPHRNKGGSIVDELLKESPLFAQIKKEFTIFLVGFISVAIALFAYFF